MSSKTIAALALVHRNQPKHFQFSEITGNALSCYACLCPQNRFPLFGRHALFPSNRAHPDGEGCNEQAYRNERQNVVDEIGHVRNSSVFTYVYFLFYFCSKVNTRFATAFILGFTNSEYTTAGQATEEQWDGNVARLNESLFRRSRTLPFETPPATASQNEVLGCAQAPT